MSAPDWDVAESWLAENANAARIARAFRNDAELYLLRMNQLKAEGGAPVDIQALGLSRMHAIQHAARIERQLRGIGD